jgi:hypothetical protein
MGRTIMVIIGSDEVTRGQAALHKIQLLRRFYIVGQKT